MRQRVDVGDADCEREREGDDVKELEPVVDAVVENDTDDVVDGVHVERHCCSTTASWYHPAHVIQ